MLARGTYIAFLSLVLLWCGLILAAPLFGGSPGFDDVSQTLYQFFSRICHQIDNRSVHLAGHKLAVCIRCSSIYFGSLLSLLIYPFVRNLRTPEIPPKWILLGAVFPICLDAALNFLGVHTSTTISRLITGSIAGFVLPFYVVPTLVEAIMQLREKHDRSVWSLTQVLNQHEQ